MGLGAKRLVLLITRLRLVNHDVMQLNIVIDQPQLESVYGYRMQQMYSCVVVHVCQHVWRVESELWPDARLSRPRCHLLLHHDHRVESWGPQGSSWTVQLCLRATEWKEVCRWLLFSFRQKLNEFLSRLLCYIGWLTEHQTHAVAGFQHKKFRQVFEPIRGLSKLLISDNKCVH